MVRIFHLHDNLMGPPSYTVCDSLLTEMLLCRAWLYCDGSNIFLKWCRTARFTICDINKVYHLILSPYILSYVPSCKLVSVRLCSWDTGSVPTLWRELPGEWDSPHVSGRSMRRGEEAERVADSPLPGFALSLGECRRRVVNDTLLFRGTFITLVLCSSFGLSF